MVAVARERRASEARGHGSAALRCGEARRRRGRGLSGAHPSPISHLAARSGRRVGSDLWWFRERLRRRGLTRGPSEATRGHARSRCRNRGQSQQSGRSDRSARRPPRSSCTPRTGRRHTDRRRGLRRFRAEAESLAPSLPVGSVVVLRSFGKAYGLAGLRLGFALASPDIVQPLREALGSWPVSGPAIAIGVPSARRFGSARCHAGAPR